jgi:predicted permease
MGWLSELRVSLRALRAMPGVAAVIIASLAIGIGVNTTVFSWIQSRVLDPLPGVARGGDFYFIESKNENGGYPGLSWPEYRDLTERLPSFSNVVAFRMAPLNIGAADWSERTYGVLVSGNYFQALGIRAVAGRLFTPEDTATPGGPPAVVVSHRFWKGRLAGADDVVGRTLRVNDRPFTIVGVAPADFYGTVMGIAFDVWAPATAVPLIVDGTNELENRGTRDYMALANLKAGASRAEGQRDLDVAMRDLAATYPRTNTNIAGEVLPQWQQPRGPQQSLIAALAMLQGVMLLVLVVVVGNTTNLVLARASARQREVGVMLALGASRWRVVRLFVTENMILALAGTVLGALIGVWGTTALRSVPLPTPGGVQLTFHTEIDQVTLGFAALLGVLSGLLIGLPAGLHLARTTTFTVVKSGTAAPGRSTIRDVFLVLEVAVAIVVLVVAATFLKSFNDTRTTDPGFKREGVMLAAYDLRTRASAIPPERSIDFADRLLDRLRSTPGIEAAAISTVVPLDIHGSPSRSVAVEGHVRPDAVADQALTNTVTPGYFQTMGIGFVEGSDFADLRDTAAPAQAIVNETFVRRYVETGQALGRRVTNGTRTYVIAGVVRDSVYDAFGEKPIPFIYLAFRDRPSDQGEIHVRTREGAETKIVPAIRDAVRELDASLPLFNVRTLWSHVDANLVFRRIPARMFAVLGPLLLLLVAVGIYAVAAYAVALRKKEIGTRMALGATAGVVIRTMVAGTLRLVGYGMVAGAAVALMIGREAPGPEEFVLLAGVATLFFASAAAASWFSARQVTQIDPIVVLKQD